MRTKWYLLGCGTSIALLIIFFMIIINVITNLTKDIHKAGKTTNLIKNNSVLHFNLKGVVDDYNNRVTPDIFSYNFSNLKKDSVHDIVLKIKTAKNDPKIKSIFLEPQYLSIYTSSMNEIIEACNDFKESGKKIYGYVTMATQTDMLLLSVADEVYMNPSASAGFLMLGVGSSFDYYKDMLDKLGIQIRVIRAGEYKSMGENYTRNNMSAEFRKNVNDLYTDRYNLLVNDFAKGYGTTTQKVKNIFEKADKFYVNMQEAIDINFITELLYYDDFLKKIGCEKENLVEYKKYTVIEEKEQHKKIAVVYLNGEITNTKANYGETNITNKQFSDIFEKIKTDNTISAVVLRINSPGGSALESDMIWERIERLKEVKPVVVSMGGVAASGGYYISAGANYIFADPYTITGSIGVLAMIPDLSGTAKKIGIHSEVVGHGKYINTNGLFTLYNKDFENALQKGILDTYLEFKIKVAQGRNMSLNDVEKIAQGQVWSAKKAIEHKLIDEIGGLNKAIEKAVQLVHLENYSIKYYPERKASFLDIIDDLNFDLSAKIPFLKNSNKELEYINNLQENPIQMRSDLYLERIQ
jgi:protease-4